MIAVPADSRSSETVPCAPVPKATMAMTAATPIVMPSMVSMVLSL
jgi:hypothetical protein